MTEKNQETTSQTFSNSLDTTDFIPPLQTPFVFPNFPPSLDVAPSNQKIEIIFAQGHRLCLQGSFDWETLSSLLTPLLILRS